VQDIGIPYSIIMVNVSYEMEVGVFLVAIFENEVYLCHISPCYDSIPEVCICLAFSLECGYRDSLSFAKVATMSGSRCGRN